MTTGTFTVPERTYTETGSAGHRRLKYRKGQKISWEEAVAEGFTERDGVRDEDVQVRVPFNIYSESQNGVRRLIHRAGTTISLAEARNHGIGTDTPARAVPTGEIPDVVNSELLAGDDPSDEAEGEDVAADEDPDQGKDGGDESQPRRRSPRPRPVRTADVPAPET